jgi:hypothetical protein
VTFFDEKSSKVFWRSVATTKKRIDLLLKICRAVRKLEASERAFLPGSTLQLFLEQGLHQSHNTALD